MKKIANLRNALLVVMVVLISSFAPKSDDAKFYDPVGIWDYEVPTDEGTLTGEMTIEENEKKDGFEIVVETDQFGPLELEEIVLDGSEMTANVEIEGDLIEFEFEFDGDSMEGIVVTPDGDLDITAERRKKK